MSKQKITLDESKSFKSSDTTRSHERLFEESAESIIELMSSIYKNQVLLELNKTTQEKFADVQVGNFANVFLSLSNKITKKLLKRFNDKRIKKLVETILGDVNKRNSGMFYGQIEKLTGISSKKLALTEGLKPHTSALILDTVQWMKKLRDETLELYTANSLRSMTLGQSLPQILEQFDGMVEKRRNHAKFTARNQINNFNSIMTKTRAQNVGITKARWVTANDERVRPCHKVRDGKEFDLDKGLHSSCDGKWLLPGVDFQCRCTYLLIIPEANN